MDIKEIINLRYAMPDVSLDKLRQCLTEVSYPKGFQVLEYGKVEKDIFFIKKGIVRAYTLVEGKEITFWVGREGATIVSMKGYVNDEPGYETMELMEDSVLYVLERKKTERVILGGFAHSQLGAALCGNGTACRRGTADFHAVCRRLGTVSRVVGERA